MNKIPEQLIKLSDKLDQAGKTKCANTIDELIEHQSLTKVAQYVGVIGYVLKQNRAMGNCIRKKRASSDASTSMQEVVLGCLSEYQDGQQYDNNEWTSKYAQVVQQCPDQFLSSHVDFLEALAEENDMNQHIARVKTAHNMLMQENIQDDFLNRIAFDVENLEKVLKEGDGDHRPFKVAAPESQRSRWSRFWSPSWSRGGKDKDTQFEMDAVIESLMNIQGDIQQIRSGISQLRYQSRSTQDPNIHQNLQSLSDTNWEQTTNGIHQLKQSLVALQQNNPNDGVALNLVQASSLIEENIEQVFDELKNVQQNMYNLRLRDPVKGRGNLKSATEEYSDLARALDRLYINPLDERALHYSLKLHGRLEDTLNERAGAQDPTYNEWVNSPESELGQSRVNPDPRDQSVQSEPSMTMNAEPSMTMDSDPIAESLKQLMSDPNALSSFVNWLKQMRTVSMDPEKKQSVLNMYDLLTEKQNNLNAPVPGQDPNLQSNVVQTETAANADGPSADELLDMASDPNSDWRDIFKDIENLRNSGKTGISASSLKKIMKVADSLDGWDSDLAKLLRDYIEEEEYQLPEFPSMSSIIKEHEASKQKIREKKAGAVALST